MKQAIVKRRFSHNNETYSKDDIIELSDGQFKDWAAVGIVAAKPRPRGK